ncbi:MAG: hypothetical protein M3Q71_19935 [Chloroflexota bacterium]|nr:hypothetical protein [Chloroflexota bacterium]
MPACAIRYRLDGPGPATYLVECEGMYHLFTRGGLGAALPAHRLPLLLDSRAQHWVPATGDISLGDQADIPGSLLDLSGPADWSSPAS